MGFAVSLLPGGHITDLPGLVQNHERDHCGCDSQRLRPTSEMDARIRPWVAADFLGVPFLIAPVVSPKRGAINGSWLRV